MRVDVIISIMTEFLTSTLTAGIANIKDLYESTIIRLETEVRRLETRMTILEAEQSVFPTIRAIRETGLGSDNDNIQQQHEPPEAIDKDTHKSIEQPSIHLN
jgi:hypothetical protein